MSAIKLGIRFEVGQIPADEFNAMLVVVQERDLLDVKRLPEADNRHD